MKRLILLCVALSILAMCALATDLNGKWAGDVPARDGQVKATFVFKVDGDNLTGNMTGPQGEVPLQEGKVSGDTVSFSTAGANAKILFQGKVAGDELKMTRTREGGQGREFTLKRAQ